MPRKSITFNGFPGGINKDSSMHDIISEGDKKDEVCGSHEASAARTGLLNAYLDEPGKVTTKLIKSIPDSSITYATPTRSGSYYSGEFTVANCIIYHAHPAAEAWPHDHQVAGGQTVNAEDVELPSGDRFTIGGIGKAYVGMKIFIADSNGVKCFPNGTATITEITPQGAPNGGGDTFKINMWPERDYGTWTETTISSTTHPNHQTVDITFRYNDPSSKQLLVHKGEQITTAVDGSSGTSIHEVSDAPITTYRNDGVYALGNDVNWDGKDDYIAETPTTGRIYYHEDTMTDTVGGKSVKIEPLRQGDLILCLGKNSVGGLARGTC